MTSQVITKMTEASKKVFDKRFVRFGINIHNEELGYAAIDGNIFGTDIQGLNYEGFRITLVEATDKKCLIVHLREKTESEF